MKVTENAKKTHDEASKTLEALQNLIAEQAKIGAEQAKTAAAQQEALDKCIKAMSKSSQKYETYCWTHGIQHSHHSHECKKKEAGHKDEATLKDKMGGSVKTWKRE